MPELTVLVGGMHMLGTNSEQSQYGVLTDRQETLSNDFFVNLLDMATEWKALDETKTLFEGIGRKRGGRRWTATRVDLVFGSNAQLGAVAEVYASEDGAERFVLR